MIFLEATIEKIQKWVDSGGEPQQTLIQSIKILKKMGQAYEFNYCYENGYGEVFIVFETFDGDSVTFSGENGEWSFAIERSDGTYIRSKKIKI